MTDGWKPIDTIPEGVAVLVADKDYVFEARRYGDHIVTDCGMAGWVTHWRHHPDPPTEDGPSHEELYKRRKEAEPKPRP